MSSKKSDRRGNSIRAGGNLQAEDATQIGDGHEISAEQDVKIRHIHQSNAPSTGGEELAQAMKLLVADLANSLQSQKTEIARLSESDKRLYAEVERTLTLLDQAKKPKEGWTLAKVLSEADSIIKVANAAMKGPLAAITEVARLVSDRAQTIKAQDEKKALPPPGSH